MADAASTRPLGLASFARRLQRLREDPRRAVDALSSLGIEAPAAAIASLAQLEPRRELPHWLLAPDPVIEDPSQLPEALREQLASALLESAEGRSLRFDPAFVHPARGTMDPDLAAKAAAAIRAAARAGAAALAVELKSAIGPEEFGRLVQGFVLNRFLPDDPAAASADVNEPAWHTALAPDERARMLAWLNRKEFDPASAVEGADPKFAAAFAAARPFATLRDLAALPGGSATTRKLLARALAETSPPVQSESSKSKLSGLAEKLDESALEELLIAVAPRSASRFASVLAARRMLRGGEMPNLDEVGHVPQLSEALRELERELFYEHPDGGCRIRIDGPSRIDVRQRVLFRGVLEEGEPGGLWSWDIYPADVARTSTYVGLSGRGLPLLGYRPERLGFALLVLRYISPGGQRCTAVRELEHAMPDCLIYFLPARTRIPRGQPAQFFARTLPFSEVEFRVEAPANVVRSFTPVISPEGERHQLDIETGDTEGTFRITAAHRAGGCSARLEGRVADMSESVREQTPAVLCKVEIIDGPKALRVGETGIYVAQGRPPGGQYAWQVVPPDAAQVDAQLETARIKPLRPGAFIVLVSYRTASCKDSSEPYGVDALPQEGDDPRDAPPPDIFGEEIAGVGVQLVRKKNPDLEEPAVPIDQNVPNCYLEIPGDGGGFLRQGTDYKVVAVRVFEEWEDTNPPATLGLEPLDLSKLDPSVRIDLRMEGKLWDTLVLIQGMTVEVDGKALFPFAPGEFWDIGFKKWYPDGSGGRNVQVEGLCVHHLRERPLNALLNEGRFHAFVSVELSEAGARSVADAQRLLDEILQEPLDPNDPAAVAARQARIIARTRNLVSAWRDALWSAVARSRHNEHVAHSINISDSCRFRVRGFPQGFAPPNGQVESEPSPRRDIEMRPDAANRVLSTRPQPDFFVTLDVYPRAAPKNFEKDGLLHGKPEEPTRGFYPSLGATDEEITYGVAASGPRCIEIRPGEQIRLDAKGKPGQWEQWIGQFTWSMVSRPPGANVSFAPVGPSPQPFTLAEVDQSGHYIARVDFVIDDPSQQCNQTYAIIDFEVRILNEVEMALLRVGDYPAALAGHLLRAFYRRRTFEAQEGTDLIVYPKGSAHLGHRLRLFLSVPGVLTLAPELTARVYTKANRSEFRDYQGAPSVRVGMAGRNTAYIDIHSLEPIYALHLIRIRYTGLLALPGHAVEVTLAVLPDEGCAPGIADDVQDPAADPEVITLPPDLEPPMEKVTTLTRVNLVLYEHDLGDARAGNAVISPLPTNEIIHADAANGNVHYEVPLFAWQGRGMPLRCSLHYNSFHAAQMEAWERMARVNGISRAERELEYARTGPGFGWSHTFGMHVIDHVLSEEGMNIRKRAELVDGVGNHIQFQTTDAVGATFRPAGRGTMIEGDAIRGASLELRELSGADGALTGYELEDLYRTLWTFDREGRLTAIATMQARESNGALLPIRVRYEGGRVVVTDTAGRGLTATLDANSRITRIENDAGRGWALLPDIKRERLGSIVNPRNESLRFTYDEFNFLRKLANARSWETAFEHHDGGDSWGRVRSISRGSSEWSVEYVAVTSDPVSRAEARDARGTRHRYEWDRDSLALLRHTALRPRTETSLGVLAGQWTDLARHEYHDEPGLGAGKFETRLTDLFGHAKESVWEAAPGGRGFLVKERLLDGVSLVGFTYDAQTRREFERADGLGRVTEHRYDRYGNLREIKRPKLEGQGESDRAALAWEYRADGSLVSRTDSAGRLTTYGYGGAGDPEGTGLATSQTLGGDSWAFAYYRSGLPRSTMEPFYRGLTDYEYDELDRLRKVTGPQAPMVDGTDETSVAVKRATTEFSHDGCGNLTATTAALGASTSSAFDPYDRMEAHTNSDGTRRYEFDALGAVTAETDRNGHTVRTERDYLGRALRITHPQRSGGVLREEFFYPDDGLGNRVRYVRGRLSQNGRDVDTPRRYNDLVYDGFGQETGSRQWTEAASGQSPSSEWTRVRDRLGNLTGLVYAVDGTERYRETYTLDAWSRISAVTLGDPQQGGATTDYALGALGEVRAVTLPEHGADSRATWRFGYDGHLRPTTLHDPGDRLVRETVYDNATASAPARAAVKAIARDFVMPDPHAHQSGSPPLQVIDVTTFDARGLPRTKRTLDFPEATLFHDENGALRIWKQGRSKNAFERDGQGRATASIVTDPARSERVQSQFDGNGNLVFLSGKEFDTVYTYDSGDRLTEEARVRGGVRQAARQLRYDALDRPTRKVFEDVTIVQLAYDEPASMIRCEVSELGATRARAEVVYHWTGDVARYTRFVDGVQTIEVTTDVPDSTGRIRKTTTRCGALSGAVELDYWPAGTRKSIRVDVPGRSFTQDDYRYWPDGQVRQLASAHGGVYQFRYHPAGHLASWENPRGDKFAIRRNAYAAISRIEAQRSATAAAPVLSALDVYPAGHPSHTKQSGSLIRYAHASGEFPGQGTTDYRSQASYDAAGLLQDLVHERSGLGERVIQRVTNTYAGGELASSVEKHEFPADPAKNFSVTRTHRESAGRRTTSSRVDVTEAELVSRYHSDETTILDAVGRTSAITDVSLVDPAIFTFFGDPRSWFRTRWRFIRDEFGLVQESWLRMESTKYDDPRFRNFRPNPTKTDIAFARNHVGQIAGRRAVVRTRNEDDQDVTLEDQRLFLYDGEEVIAEVGKDGKLARYYEYGPGEGFRLNVLHTREAGAGTGGSAGAGEVLEHYLYSSGMASVALAGEDGRIKLRFQALGLPGPGDNRRDRFDEDDEEDDFILSTASPLYVSGAEPSLGGMPPYVRSDGPAVVGSGLGGTPDPEAVGVLRPHRALVEDPFDTTAEMVPASELPRPRPEEKTAWDTFVALLDWLISINPVFGPGYRLSKQAYQVATRGDDVEVLLFVSNLIWDALAARYGIPINPIEPLVMSVSAEDYTWADYALALFDLRDPLVVINGYDPVTGATYTWSERFDSVVSLTGSNFEITPLVELGEGCFPGATEVWTPRGPRRIDELSPGEQVLSSRDGKLEAVPIADVRVHEARLLAVQTTGGTVLASQSQPLLVRGRGFLRAEHLAIGDALADARGALHRVLSIGQTETPSRVYSLSVSETNTYLVGTPGWVAHNKPPRGKGKPKAKRKRRKRPKASIQAANGRVVQLNLVRVNFSEKIRNALPLKEGVEDRRHIVAQSFMQHMIEEVLSDTDFAQAERILTRAGHPPSDFAKDPKTGALRSPEQRILRAAESWLRRLNNQRENLWVGDAKENQEFGERIAKEGRKVSDYEPWLFDVEPGSDFEKRWNANP